MVQDPTKPGAAEDEPEESELEEPEGAEDGAEGEEEEWTPPTREQWQAQQEAHQAALKAERAKLARARKQAERLRKGAVDQEGADGAPAGEGTGPAAQAGEAVWRRRAVRASAKAQLLDRGADSETVALMLEGLKPEIVGFDDQDEPELDDWLDEMEERYPKLFTKPGTSVQPQERQRPGRIDQGAAAGSRPARAKLSLGEQILANSQAGARRRA